MSKMSSKDRNLPTPTRSTSLGLRRAKSLTKLTDSVLGGNHSLTLRDAWLDELFAWADENGLSEYELPRDKEKALALVEMKIVDTECSEVGRDSPERFIEFPASIRNLTNLQILQVETRGVGGIVISEPFVASIANNLPHLRELHLYTETSQLYKYRNPVNIPDSIADLKNIEVLALESISFMKSPRFIGDMVNLRELSLEDCVLPELPDSIGNLINLEKLDLSSCSLLDGTVPELPEWIGNLVNLTDLNLIFDSYKVESAWIDSRLRSLLRARAFWYERMKQSDLHYKPGVGQFGEGRDEQELKQFLADFDLRKNIEQVEELKKKRESFYRGFPALPRSLANLNNLDSLGLAFGHELPSYLSHLESIVHDYRMFVGNGYMARKWGGYGDSDNNGYHDNYWFMY